MSYDYLKWSKEEYTGLYRCTTCQFAMPFGYQFDTLNTECPSCEKQKALAQEPKGTLKFLNANSITPESVLAMTLENSSQIESIVIVTKDKIGNHQIHCACSIADLAMAVMVIQEHFTDVRSGRTPTHFDGSKEPK